MSEPLFDEDDFDEPTKDLLKQISEKANELDDAQRCADELAAELKAANAEVLRISSEELPDLMEEAGMKHIMTANGVPVTIEEVVKAKMPETRREEALRWLEDNHEGGMIDSVLSVTFNRSQTEQAAALAEGLREDYDGVEVKGSVHHSRLRAWAKRKVEAGEEFPHELFGVFIVKRAKLGS